MSLFRLRQLLLPVLLGMLSAAHSQEPRPSLPLDCWISADDAYAPMHYIACIHDRGDRQSADEALDPPEVVALDTIHRLLHDGSQIDLDRYVRASAAVLRKGDVRKLRLFTYPSQWSWNEGRPQLLATILCPEGFDCPVFIRRWGTLEPVAPVTQPPPAQ